MNRRQGEQIAHAYIHAKEGAGKIAESSEKVKLITDCKHLTMAAFMAAVEEGDYSGLILSGSPTEAQISAAWEGILGQYIDLTADEERGVEIAQAGVDKATEVKVNCIRGLLVVAGTLKAESPQELLDVLNDEGYGLDVSKSDEEIKAQLALLMTRLETEIAHMEAGKERAKRKRESKGGKPEEKLTAQFFYKAVVKINSVLGVNISLQNLMVAEFCAYFQAMCNKIEADNEYAEKLKNAHANAA